MRWVHLHPCNISQEVEIVVEHFRSTVAPLLDGKAKAMVVLGSRVETVRSQIAVNKYIKSRGYVKGTLVASRVRSLTENPDPIRLPRKVRR